MFRFLSAGASERCFASCARVGVPCWRISHYVKQLAVLKRRHPRPRLDLLDKLFWVAVRRFWSGWQQFLIVVTPETVVRWHRTGFRLYWKLISKVRRPVGRRQPSKEIQELIFRMVVENSTCAVMQRLVFASLFLFSLFAVAGGGAQSPAESEKPVWTMEFIKVLPGKFWPTLGYLDDNWMRIREEAKHEGAVLSYHRIAEQRIPDPNISSASRYARFFIE